MSEKRRTLHLESLNRAFEKAFAHTAGKETLLELLECIGTELMCDRIAIFEMSSDNTCDNTYEWCREGCERVRELFQHVALEDFDSWTMQLQGQEFLRIRDLETIRESDPDVYRMLHAQDIRAVIASRLAFHGKDIGFFILENPGEEILADAVSVMPGMRYILSSLVYSDHLVRKLRRLGQMDRLTGVSSRSGLARQLDLLEPSCSIGVAYCEVIGWDGHDHDLSRVREEQALIRTGEIMSSLFGSDCVFSTSPAEFLAIVPDTEQEAFSATLTVLKNLFLEHSLLVSVGACYRASCDGQYDSIIRQAHMDAHDRIRELTLTQSQRQQLAEADHFADGDMADISMYRNDDFFRHASDFLSQVIDERVITIVIDLNYFKLYNDIFGRKAGNLFLESMASEVLDVARKKGGVAGYLGGDNFCLLLPVKDHTEDSLTPFVNGIVDELDYPDGFAPALGIYLSENLEESFVAMYDHALTALQEIKGSYVEHYRFYDADHYRRDRDTKLLLMDVKKGLPEGEFLFYLQPQVIEKTGKIVGAEALVRWMCKGQLVSPGQFVPALEKSGYIYAVDCFVWESVVKWIADLKTRGIKPVPVSVNVSRVDFYFDDIANHFIELTKRYGVEPSLLGVEITESAFTDNTDTILDSVTRLHDAGFRVLMDDFGSGSSSLSMLHTMNLDVLKTDVRFMSRKNSDSKAISIVESVVSMAHMIGMIVITEGVETEQQRDNLIAIGDNYAQGFYFYRPMPAEQFEQLLLDSEKIGTPPSERDRRSENQLKFRELVREGMLSETLLDNLIGAAAVYRLEGDEFSIVQMNAHYAELTGVNGQNEEEQVAFTQDLFTRNRSRIESILSASQSHPYEGTSTIISVRSGGKHRNLTTRVYPLYTCDSHSLYFTTLEEP